MEFSLAILSLPTIDELIVSPMIIIVRTIIESSATLFLGILIAAGIRSLGGYPKLSTWLDEPGSILRTLRLMAISACVPLCAFGVIPVARELSNSGMPKRDVVTLWLVAPLLNPLSLLYAVNILPVWQCAMLVAIAVCYGVVVAEVASRFVSDASSLEPSVVPEAYSGTARLWNIAITAGKIATSWTMVYIAIGLLATAVVATFIDPGSFEGIVSAQNSLGPVVTQGLTAPQMVTPVTFVMAASAIHHAHLSFACAIALYLLGVSWNGGTISAMRGMFGASRVMSLLLVTLILATMVTYSVHVTLPPSVGQEEETHGLDTLARPYHAELARWSPALEQQLGHTDVIMRTGSMLLAILVAWGIVVRWQKLSYKVDEPTPRTSADSQSRLNVELTPGQIGVVAMLFVGLVCVGVMYSIFPSVEESFAEMQKLQADAVVAVNTNERDLAQQKLTEWDNVAAKMPVGWLLRFGLPDKEQAFAIRQLRESIWDTRSKIADPQTTPRDARDQGRQLLDKFRACRTSCLGEQT